MYLRGTVILGILGLIFVLYAVTSGTAPWELPTGLALLAAAALALRMSFRVDRHVDRAAFLERASEEDSPERAELFAAAKHQLVVKIAWDACTAAGIAGALVVLYLWLSRSGGLA